MPATVTIVTYHFVRDLRNSRFPAIKGLDLEAFRGQLQFMQKHYAFISMEDVLAVLDGRNNSLPSSAALLTFDDGYIDHFTNVFPLLDEMQVQGCFFPTAQAVLEHRVLDVNKIHFVLASVPDAKPLAQLIKDAVNEHKTEFGLADVGYYWEHFSTGHRYDPPEIVFIKRMLQRALPERLRSRLIDELFRRYVSANEAAFARELYVDTDQLRCMRRHGMFIGSHGYTHRWLDSIPREEQETEIELSKCFLTELGVDIDRWVMCYPYGGYDDALITVLRRKGCALGLTVNPDLADLGAEDALALSRLDTNDLPKRADAAADPWTLRVNRQEA